MPNTYPSIVFLLPIFAAACQGAIAGEAAPAGAAGAGTFSANEAPGTSPALGNAAAKAAAPSLPLPPVTGKGLLDCPSVAYPGRVVSEIKQETAPLPAVFGAYCAACHGAVGEGRPGYKALATTTLSYAEFSDVVRSGRGNMPRFDASIIGDAELKGSFDRITQGALGGSLLTQHPALSWSTAEVEAKRSKGLAAFRQPDANNEACSHCHAPDGIDLAFIAYPDEAILRRAGLHVPPDQALAVLDFIHAQRRHYNITEPCSTDWRPFQPGGTVLPGTTDEEQDESFWAELRKRNILVAQNFIETEADAEAAWKQLAALNMRTLPNGIPLPRWAEDSFDGDEHKSVNDWIPSAPRVPKDGEFLRLYDEYVADPTLEKISAIASRLDVLTHDNDFSDIQTGGYRPTFPEFFLSKYRAVLIASHYFRMAALNRNGWVDDFQTAPSPMAMLSNGQMISPMQSIGFLFQEDNCFADAGCRPAELAALPHLARLEVGDDPATFKTALLPTLAHAWWSVGTLLDPILSERPFARANSRPTLHYWMGHFSQRQIHRPFYTAVINAKRSEAMSASSPNSKVYPLLEAKFHEDSDRSNLGDFNSNRLSYVFLQHNTLRMELLLMKRALRSGSATTNRDEIGKEVARVAAWINARNNGQELVAQPGDAIDVAALTTLMVNSATLATELEALIAAAPIATD